MWYQVAKFKGLLGVVPDHSRNKEIYNLPLNDRGLIMTTLKLKTQYKIINIHILIKDVNEGWHKGWKIDRRLK